MTARKPNIDDARMARLNYEHAIEVARRERDAAIFAAHLAFEEKARTAWAPYHAAMDLFERSIAHRPGEN